jgi:hypothetical protein
MFKIAGYWGYKNQIALTNGGVIAGNSTFFSPCVLVLCKYCFMCACGTLRAYLYRRIMHL